MEEFVAVLEATLPNFFKGSLKLYRQGNQGLVFFLMAILNELT